MKPTHDPTGPERTHGELSRRGALGLAAWSAGVAVAGAVAGHLPARLRHPLSVEPTGAAGPRTPNPSSAGLRAPTARTSNGTTKTAIATTPRPEERGAVDAAVHLARRATFGPTTALLAEIRSAGVDLWLDRQLDPMSIDDTEVERRLHRLRDLERGPAELRSLGQFSDQLTGDLRVAALVRAVGSNRHLLEVMTDLWHDHLVVSSIKPPVAWHLPRYDRDVIRRHALGRYTDLLHAATTSGAMLEYLDTASSTIPQLNENHGRELLELHTVGLAAGYTEADVTGASRVLSGWTVEPEHLGVVFDPARHDAGPARVLGWTTPGRSDKSAAQDLPSLLEYLAKHPATANRIATLLTSRFVADIPPPELVASTANAYLASGTDLAATLRHLLTSQALRTSSTTIVRRPFDLLAAQLRATSATLDVPNAGERILRQEDASPLGSVLGVADLVDGVAEPLVRGALPERPLAATVTRVLGRQSQPLFAAADASGHPLVGTPWSSGDALLQRWTLAAAIAQNLLPGITIDPELLAAGASTAGATVDALVRTCLNTPAPETRRAALSAMGRDEADQIDAADVRRSLAFVLAAPEMQLR